MKKALFALARASQGLQSRPWQPRSPIIIHQFIPKGLSIPLLLFLVLLSSFAQAKYSGGAGTPEDPYKIADYNDLYTLADDTKDYNKCFCLTADIDLDPALPGRRQLTTALIAPDTNTDSGFQGIPFTGTFDGNDCNIFNLTIDTNGLGNDYLGLFGHTDTNAVISNLGVRDVDITGGTGSYYVGGLVGDNYGSITNCYATGPVTGHGFVGGLVGGNYYGSVTESYATGEVTGNGNFVGGLAGINDEALISNSSFSGTVTTIGDAGGLVGYNPDGQIRDCYAIGEVSSTSYVGGLVGYNPDGKIYNSYAICDVNGTGANVGGLVGDSWYGIIGRCFSGSLVNGQDKVGGLVGDVYHTYITNCYSTGGVTGQSNVGGLAGYCNTARLLNCYSAGLVVGASNTGGLTGSSGGGYATNCFWDVDSTGQPTSSMGTGETTQQMKQLATFISWACDDVWTIDESIDYPRLYFEQKEGLSLIPYSYWHHTGEPNDPILISTADQLLALGSMPCQWDKHFILLNDINMQGQGMTIGNSTLSEIPFTGDFEGNHNSISNLSIYNDNGLFGHINSPAAVVGDLTLINPHIESGSNKLGALVGYLENGLLTDCHVIDGYIEGYDYIGGLIGDSNQSLHGLTADAQVFGHYEVGGLVGYNPGKTIKNCCASGQVSGIQFVGGLVGSDGNSSISSGKIIDCLATADVSCVNPIPHSGVGGLIGMSYGCIQGSRATGNVKCNELCSLGGLTGCSHNIISNSTAAGSVTGGGKCGGLVGSNSGQIISCNASGNVTNYSSSSSASVGGLVGQNYDTISDCFATGKVEGYHYIGGLVGVHSSGEINRCYAEGEVIGTQFTGGLIGYHSEADVSKSHALGRVTGDNRTGGLIGQITNHHGTTSVTDCYATGDTNGIDDIGGLVGFVYMGYEGNIYISRCYSSGDVYAETKVGGLIGRVENDEGAVISGCFSYSDVYLASDYGGGLVGYYDTATMEDCYARGDIIGSATSRYLGGLIGYKDHGNVSDSYAAGNVEGLSYIGGLVGSVYGSERIYDCFWDIETGAPDNGIGTGLPTSQMQTESTFTDAGWDFNDVWAICEGTNYPSLIWSMSLADMLCPDGVTFIDYSYFADHWLWSDYGDVNGIELSGNGKIENADFALLADFWGQTSCGDCGGADYTGDYAVDSADLQILFDNWLETDFGDCEGAELTGDGFVGIDDALVFSEQWLQGF